jgi:exopolyphosphatase / guanosine-5'-triphosphate,3'-diphosphate pyrophosphatase
MVNLTVNHDLNNVNNTEDQPRQRILAAIDMGTNSLHMVIVRIIPELSAFNIIGREKETVRLGDRTAEGHLKLEIMHKAIAALRRFQEIAKTLNAEQVIAVATSAVRESPNGREFLQDIERELGLYVDLISGPEEARRIYLGVLSGMEFNNKSHIIMDIGGGSTELILGDGHEPRSLSSTKIGAVRLTTEFIKNDPISNSEFQFLQAYIRGMLERPIDEIKAELNPGEKLRFVGTSGTIETIASIYARDQLKTVPTTLNGYKISLQYIKELVNRIRKLNIAERTVIPGISEKRAEIILAGALILQEAMVMLGVDSVTICERSLREGVIVDWMIMHGLIADKLRFQSSVRERSTMKIANKYQVNLEYSERVAKFALDLFDQTDKILHQWGAEEKELLWTAAILHNCGHHVGHSAHHKHSYYLIRNSELLGFSEMEIEIIANLARYHRKSPPKKRHENLRGLTARERQVISELSALLRVAVALDRRQIGAIAEIKCDYKPSSKELKLWLKPTDKNDSCDLELWSLNYKKDLFEAVFESKLSACLY